MEPKAGAQISRKSFIQSLLILLALMLLAGILTLVIPSGSYQRQVVDGREVILPGTFVTTAKPDYPAWRWLTAPFEALGGSDGVILIVIILFVGLVATSFAVMDKTGLLRASLASIVRRFGNQKYVLLWLVSFFFGCLGAFFGLFEEIVPLVPLAIALSYSMGWDTLVGLGMSILATNVGFSAAITNPFTIGVAQQLADLPLFSGAGLRVVIFAASYLALAVFLTRYARRVERNPQESPVFAEDHQQRSLIAHFDARLDPLAGANMRRAGIWLAAFLALILVVLVSAPFLPFLTDISLPIVGLLFFLGGVGAGFLSGAKPRLVFQAMGEGLTGILPALPLVLMAASVKYIVATGGILDTILHSAAGAFTNTSPAIAALMIYALALVIEFFVGSASAKAILLMPILIPLADLVGVTRQVAVTAYCFGDGFSNLAYPTNPVLLICLGLTVVSYAKWMRWLLKLWFWIGLLTVGFLFLAVAIQYGP